MEIKTRRRNDIESVIFLAEEIPAEDMQGIRYLRYLRYLCYLTFVKTFVPARCSFAIIRPANRNRFSSCADRGRFRFS